MPFFLPWSIAFLMTFLYSSQPEPSTSVAWGQQPGELHVMSGGGVVFGVGLLAAFGEPVPAPDNVELDLRGDLPVNGELRNAVAYFCAQSA